MAKLMVNVSMLIDTGPLVVHNHKKSKAESIEGKKLEMMLAGADQDKLGFEVAAANDGAFILFVFNESSGKKDSVIEVAAKPDKLGLTCKIEGQFEVKLRSGVAPFLGKYGKDLDLRVTSITLNDGKWSGFNAYPVGIDGLGRMADYFYSLPMVNEYVVK